MILISELNSILLYFDYKWKLPTLFRTKNLFKKFDDYPKPIALLFYIERIAPSPLLCSRKLNLRNQIQLNSALFISINFQLNLEQKIYRNNLAIFLSL